jgi:SAM-dependent methyltransferase
MNLAPVWDRLFPPGPTQIGFIVNVLARLHHPARRLLDAGCATGGYALALADRGYEVTGIDLSPEMIREALAKSRLWAQAQRAGGSLERAGPRPPLFFVSDMMNLDGPAFDESKPFDGVICLGNTLAHLLSAAELGAALGEMARVLAPGGAAILQTVNYDRLAATGEMKFPPITLAGDYTLPAAGGGKAPPAQPANLVFERHYLPRPDGLLTFATSLRDASTGQVIRESRCLLRPTDRAELATVAAMAFHGQVKVYGDFLFSPWSEASPGTVVVAGREWD